ncbi:High affinity sulfate transporter 2 [Dichanthelium oligosanthes]|uniref:High affinity sulfate transporter 2 n=1 Tax=Dichanthelium oligosanthes TaxID=888268 RepID=A0A1E5WBV0_9POAL|nr:High affinity sulfate transporter 2 [Dichanthelium oligosanthes]
MPRAVSDGGENLNASDGSGNQALSHCGMDSSGYRVSFPPKKSLLEEFSDTVKDMFFAGDDPLRQYKEQPSWSKRVWLSLQHVFPVLEWGRHYTLGKFKGDFIAGLTIASLCIPQDIGYSKLANLPPEIGLYSSFVTPLIYTLMGSSRDLAIGPVAVVSLLLGSLLKNEIDPKKHPLEYQRLAFTATFFAGITQAALGFFRLGFIIEFLSHAAIVGFMAGAAITIALQQLKGFLGIRTFTTSTDIVSVMKSIFKSAHHGWNWQTILIGASFLGFLLVTKYIGKKNKKLFWMSATAPLISVIISTFFVYITHADKHGVAVVKNIEKGVNPPSANLIYFSGPFLLKGFKIGVVAGLIALTEAIAIGRTFASMKDYQLDGNKEMMALGTMNVILSDKNLFIIGGFGRSAVNCMAGCKTAASNIVMSIVVLLTLLFITPLFKYTPNAILSSIIISAVLGLIDYKAAYLIWKVDKLDFLACLGAFIGVVFSSVEYGLLIAVAISIAKILLQATRPKTALLGNLPRTTIYRNIEQYPDVTTVPGVVIVRVDSAIYFTNANYVKERTLRWFEEEEERQRQQKFPQIEFLIVELSPVVDIDTSGIHALEELFRTLEKRKIQLILANPGPTVIQKLRSAKFTELIGEDRISLTVGDAVKKFAPKAVDSV